MTPSPLFWHLLSLPLPRQLSPPPHLPVPWLDVHVGAFEDGSMLSMSISSAADGSSNILQRPKKKGQFTKKERKYNKLVSLINSTRRTKKWDVEVVLSEFGKISNL